MAGTRMSDIGALIYAGIDAVFERAAKKPRRLYYPSVVTVKPNKKREGWYDTIGNLGPAEIHNEEDPITYDKIEYNNRTTITTNVIAKGVKGSMESIEFDLENVVKHQFGEPLVKALIQKKERIIADVYNDVFSATGADGVAQAASNHPLMNHPTKVNDNLLSGEISPDKIIEAKNRFNAIYDQSGEFFDTEPTHLLIHPNKMFLALQILNSNLMALELSNTKNVVQDVMPIKVLVNKYLDYDYDNDISPWFMLDRTLDAGCVLQTKGGLNLNTEWDWDILAYKGVAYEMYGAGMIAPGYGFIASPGS